MEQFTKLLADIENREIKVSDTAKGKQIFQPQRNALKRELLDALFADLKAEYEFIYHSEEGKILVEVANPNIADAIDVNADTGSGAMTFEIDLKILGLDVDASFADETYEFKRKEAEEEAKKKAEAKAAKIARDTKARAEKKAEMERRKAEMAEKGE